MKKIIALLLTALLVAGMLAACGEEATTTAETTAATEAPTEDTRPKLSATELQAIALAEAGMPAEYLNSIDIHQGDYDGKECVSVQLIIRDKDYEFIIDVHTGEVLLSVFPEG